MCMSHSTPIRKIRRSKELSQDELSRRSGVERSKLCRAERGYRTLTREELKHIARALRVDVEQLTDGEAE